MTRRHRVLLLGLLLLPTAATATGQDDIIKWLDALAPYRELRNRNDAPVPTRDDIEAALNGDIVSRRGAIPGTTLHFVWAARILDVDPRLFWLAIIDREHYEQLSDNILESIVTDIGPHGFFSYNVLQAPLVSRRHQVLECFVNQQLYQASGGRIWEHYWHRADNIDQRIHEALQSPKLEHMTPDDVANAVVVAHNDGSWMLIPLPDGRLWAETYSANDPGGSIPDFIVRKVAASSTEKTLTSYESWVRRQGRVHFGSPHPDVLAPDGRWVQPADWLRDAPVEVSRTTSATGD